MMKIAKRVVLAASILAAATMVSSGAGARTSGIMYHHTFYSDASMTTQVGWYRDKCWGNYVQATPVHGTTSPYYTLEAIGSCPGGYW